MFTIDPCRSLYIVILVIVVMNRITDTMQQHNKMQLDGDSKMCVLVASMSVAKSVIHMRNMVVGVPESSAIAHKCDCYTSLTSKCQLEHKRKELRSKTYYSYRSCNG